MRTIKFRPASREQESDLDRYLIEHGLTQSEVMRMALARQLQRKPTRREIAQAQVKRGNPNFAAKPE